MKQWRLLVIPLLCWGSTIGAEGPETSISYSKARELILAGNGDLKATVTETEAARAGLQQAGVFRNPNIGVALDNFGMNEIEVSAQQTIELGGKRRLRTESAHTEFDAVLNKQSLTRLELDAEIVRRFVPITIVSNKLSLLDSIITIAEAGKEQIRKRVDAGASKKTDLLRAEIELERLALQRNEFVRELSSARRKFAALGREQDSILEYVSGTLDDRSQLPTLDDFRKAVAGSPRIFAFSTDKARLATQQKQLQADVVPDLNLSAGILRNTTDNALSPLLGLSMDVPLFNRNTAAQQQTRYQQQAIDERIKSSLKIFDADVQDLYSRLVEIDNKISVLRAGAIPKAESVYSMLQDYYIAGSVGFLDLTATRAEMLGLRMDLLDIEAERALVLADLMQTTSLLIPIVK